MKPAKKITVHLPDGLLEKALKTTGQGITETVRLALKLISSSKSYEELQSLRGKVKFSLDLKALKDDRK